MFSIPKFKPVDLEAHQKLASTQDLMASIEYGRYHRAMLKEEADFRRIFKQPKPVRPTCSYNPLLGKGTDI